MFRFIISVVLLTSVSIAKLNTVVSILPEKSFLQAIGGDKVSITVMVKPGSSPHSYEPKPSQMKYISKAQIYFAIGVEFEKAWLNRFKTQNSNLHIIDISKDITKIDMKKTNYKKATKDPHIWTSPSNIKILAKNIYNTLVKFDAKNREYYQKNYKNFILHVNKIDKQIKTILKNTPLKSKFMVFHPSWGYFAKEYNLIQLPIEVEGKSPKPKTLIKIIKTAKKEHISLIITQPEFSDKSAKQIAKELNISVVKLSPMSLEWDKTILTLAKAISK